MKEATQYTVPIYRIQLVKEKTIDVGDITSARNVADHLRDAAQLDRECLVVLFLNTRNQPIGMQTLSVGTLNAAIIHPREVFKGALLANANSIILAHNHPSGNPSPSDEDNKITKMLSRAGALLGVSVLDHVVLSPTGDFYSYQENKSKWLGGGK